MAEKIREQKAKSFRLLHIEQLIKTMNYPNVPDLMRETGMSRATIMRDLDSLKDDYDAPIEYDFYHRGYYYTDENYKIRNVNQVFKAIKNHKVIEFGYRSIKATEHTPHTAHPYKIYNQKGDWYVICYNPKHDDYIAFTLARMKDVVVKEAFEPDPDYASKVKIDPYFGIWNNDNPPQKIELVFDKSINTYILERTWHKNQECHQNEDGSVYLSFESNQTQEVLFWILKFGSQVKVLSPESLKKQVFEEHRKAAELYG